MQRQAWLTTLGCWVLTGALSAGEIGFLEEFSLAPDRTVPLQQLIPGTEDYYYFHALHYQNTEQWPKVEETLRAWIDRYNRTPRVIEIENRQALLTYGVNPDQSLKLIRDRLNLQFNHQKEPLNPQSNLPSVLDPQSIAPAALTAAALARYPRTVEGFEDASLEWLIATELDPERRRHLLTRLTRPDYVKLPQVVVDDLNSENSGGFGQFLIHGRLLLSQLDECLKLKPDLLNQGNFVNAYLTKLHPSDDANWRQDPAALEAYLDRLWAFVSQLQPVHNSLKAHVLYHRLVLDRSRGVYHAERFLDYLKLPRNVGYMEPRYLQLDANRQWPANVQADYAPFTLLAPIGNDEPLVRSYLQHFLVEAEDYKAYTPYIADGYLKATFAETKIVLGLGDPEKWYSLLSPAAYQALKERIDLDFAFTNKTEYSPEEPVGLDLYVKNVNTLIVKVFEVNTQNFYRENLSEIGTEINLDGLVANSETTHVYQEPALRRVQRHFEFPGLNRRGVYVIDFIGNGMSSRALIRKGKLRYLMRTGAAGQVFTVLDEKNQRVPDATLWLGGTLYTPNESGQIVTPFSSQPGQQPIILSTGKFSSLESVNHESETYRLVAGMHVDRESLLSRKTAELVIRPSLLLNETPVSFKVLEDLRLLLVSRDHEGVATSKEVSDLKLLDDRETRFQFAVPQRLASIQFVLKGKVQNLNQNRKQDVEVSQSYILNEIDRTEKTEDLHLLQINGSYVVDLLGRSGEAQPRRAVHFQLKHRDYRDPVQVTLQSGAGGRIVLGPLPGIATITATGPQSTQHVWPLRKDVHSLANQVHGGVDMPVQIPYMGLEAQPSRDRLSLLELRGDNFVADRFEALSLDRGMLRVAGLPPGDYSLRFKDSGREVRIRLTDGEHREGYILGGYRKLETRDESPLQLAPVEVTDDTVKITVRNAGQLSRVHVFASRFQPAFSAYDDLARIGVREPSWLQTPRFDSLYVIGRNIGDEYRYIIDRKFKPRFPGNMLERPSLLLNPWAVRSTETGEQQAQAGEDFDIAKGAGAGVADPGEMLGEAGGGNTEFSNLDFLAQTSTVVLNLVPNEAGVIEVKRADLGSQQDLVVVAVDPQNIAARFVTLPERMADYIDLRLQASLDPQQHFTQQKRITVLPTGGTLVLPDITSTKFESYDSLTRVYGLYTTLNPDPKLAEFGFLLNWPKLKLEEKRTLYSKYASHELSFFLSRKDPEFFRTVILPYLANKKDKTFLDHWLLESDLSVYRQPWKFAQLNTVERILLSRRVDVEQPLVKRFVTDQFDLLPPDIERFNLLYRTALKGSALDTGDALGLEVAKEKASSLMLGRLADTPAAPAEAAAPAPMVDFGADKQAGARFAGAKRQNQLQEEWKKSSERLKDVYRARDAAPAAEDQLLRIEEEQLRAADMDMKDRQLVRQLYEKLDKTQEWAENNYYNLVIEEQNAQLIPVNSFWRDFADHDPAQPFYSVNVADASRNFPEMLLALAVLDLPFDAAKHETAFEGTKMTLKAGSPLVAYHEEIQPAPAAIGETSILVSQNFFRYGDRYRHVNNEQLDRFVTEEFLVDTVYGCQVVITNPTSSPKKLDVLLQIPQGAFPVLNGQYTRSVHTALAPYNTQTIEYHFYFPSSGQFTHYPVQVAEQEKVLAFAPPFAFHVVDELTNIDKESWDYVSQHGTDEDVMTFLKRDNVLRINLSRIAFRMRDKAFFQRVVALLEQRHAFDATLWSYGVMHNEVAAIREFLQHQDGFVQQCGDLIDSPLLTIDPVARHTYQHLDYKPLVNARVGQLGRNRQILNNRFLGQYQQLLKLLSYRRSLNDDELMAVTYYLLLQDRVEEALALFGKVNPERLATRLQYDYFTAYLDFSQEKPQHALEIAAKYADHPVDRWRNAFANITNQANEIANPEAKVADVEDRNQVQAGLAATAPSFDFTVDARKVKLNFQNLKQVRVNYYLMDIELLFSRNPFVQQHSRQFSYILPNATETIDLPANLRTHEFVIPENLANSNVLVEVTGEGLAKSQAYYSNALAVQTIESYGQVRVTHGKAAQPLSKVYVKAYARMQDGTIRFYKDGYTDLRGRFDYTSLNTNELEAVERFSLLILSDEHGAVVREASPPKR